MTKCKCGHDKKQHYIHDYRWAGDPGNYGAYCCVKGCECERFMDELYCTGCEKHVKIDDNAERDIEHGAWLTGGKWLCPECTQRVISRIIKPVNFDGTCKEIDDD